ncbi:MAG: 50S ribosomal protein L24 [Pseudomonadales bacterium]|jgi:large subunit ribosomal protein L24|nr:50S ribosomal protein L24 [Pseudomonadales bacterium]
MRKIRSKDEVVVIAGRDKGKRGEVSRVMADGRVIVSGINIVKKHTRPDPYRGIEGGIVEKEAPMDASNLAIWNADESRADRVGFRVEEDGTKVRFFKSTGKAIGS